MTALGVIKSFLNRFKVCFPGENSHLVLYSGYTPVTEKVIGPSGEITAVFLSECDVPAKLPSIHVFMLYWPPLVMEGNSHFLQWEVYYKYS